MPSLFVDEHLDVGFGNLSTTGSPVISTTVFQEGTGSMRVQGAAVQKYAAFLLDSANKRLVGRFMFRQDLFSGGTCSVLRIGAGSGDKIYISASVNTMLLKGQSSGGVDSQSKVWPGTAQLGRWYLFDFDLNANANPWVCNWRVDGEPQVASQPAFASSGLFSVAWGNIDTTDTVDSYYDVVALSYASADYPIGAGPGEAELAMSVSSALRH